MKVILDSKWLIPAEMMEHVLEVVSDNSWREDANYTIKGEATAFKVIQDSQLLTSDDFKLVKLEQETEALKKSKSELDALKLKAAREQKVDEILKQKRGLSREDVTNYVNTLQSYSISSASSDKALEWRRNNK